MFHNGLDVSDRCVLAMIVTSKSNTLLLLVLSINIHPPNYAYLKLSLLEHLNTLTSVCIDL